MTIHKCDNCGLETVSLDRKWPDIPDIIERLEPGGIVPSGTCPECSALCYPMTDSPEKQVLREYIAAVQAVGIKKIMADWPRLAEIHKRAKALL